jgi:hypothetical protein
MDALHTREVRRTQELFLDHLKRIRAMPFMRDAMAVLCLESNLAFESQQWALDAFEPQTFTRHFR